MFSVYGINGRLYSGALDGLRELQPVQAVARTRAAQRVGMAAVDGEGAEAAPSHPALAAYARMQQTGPAPSKAALPRVADIMSRRVLTVPISATVAEGLALLGRAGVAQAPVVDGGGALVGLLLRTALQPAPERLHEGAAWQALLDAPVAEAMWTPVPAVEPEAPLAALAQLLLELELPGLPVLDGSGAMLGFVARGDILRAVARLPSLDLWS